MYPVGSGAVHNIVSLLKIGDIIMTTFSIIATATESLKAVRNDLRDGNKEYTSISRVLKDIQRKEMMKCGYGQVFASLHLSPAEGKERVEPADFFAALAPEMWGRTTNKAGVVSDPWVGVWGTAAKKDAEGNKILDAQGNPVTEAKLRKITAWSPTKLFKVWAQSEAFKAAAAEKKA